MNTQALVGTTQTFKNFNEVKAKFFPQLVEEEKQQELRKDIKKLAVYLANQSIEKVVHKR